MNNNPDSFVLWVLTAVIAFGIFVAGALLAVAILAIQSGGCFK